MVFQPYDKIIEARDSSRSKSLEINEQCFIRKDHKCGKMFGASKSCFIACPSEDSVEITLQLISEKLSKVGIEPIIAVKERAYGQDIFCTKICGKIIESKFCLVILNDSIEEGKNIPNSNVYYEYGLMTALEKHIIPLQEEYLKLAFNIQSYDTIKYNSKNLSSELDRAIKDAIKITESKSKITEKQILSDKSILRKFELADFKFKNERWFLSDVIDDTDFKGFGQHKVGFYLYLGKIDEENEFQSYIEDLNVLIYRTEEKYRETEKRYEKVLYDIGNFENDDGDRFYFDGNDLEDLENDKRDIKNRMQLMNEFYIAFFINPKLDRTKFVTNAENIISEYCRYKLVCDDNDKMIFGDVQVDLSPFLDS